jgi:hypothetical protein
MALTLAVTVTPANPAPGQPLTVTYAVTGEPTPPPDAQLTGSATVDGMALQASSTVHFANVEKFDPPTLTGYKFTQSTTDPKVWTGTPA